MPKSDKKKLPQSPEIVQEFLEEEVVKTYRGEFYRFNGAFYEPVSKGAFRHSIAKFIQDRFGNSATTNRMVTECVGLVADLTHLEIKSQPTWLGDPTGEIASVLVVENGVLDLSPMYDGGEPRLIPYTPELFATAKSDLTYDPDATCPKFENFLEWFTCGDGGLVLLLLQYMAYTLLRRLNLQRFMVLTGSGSNGKSVFLKVLQKLVGAANCSALGIERLGGRFNLAALSDKSINIAADANEITKVAEGNLKMLVDGSELTFERKHQDPYNAVCYTTLIFAANVFPRIRDRTDGFWRRLLVVLCTARVAGGDVRREIEETFNMAGVLNRVLGAGTKLVSDGDFTVPQCVIDATEAERFEANPTMRFFRDNLVEDKDAFSVSTALYHQYASWCDSFGYMALAENNFGKELRLYFRSQMKTGVVRHGKSKSKPRENGYWGFAFAVHGPDDYLERLAERRAFAAEKAAERAEQEARCKNDRESRRKVIASQQAAGVLQSNDNQPDASIRDAFNNRQQAETVAIGGTTKDPADEIRDALADHSFTDGGEQKGASDV